MTLLVAFDINDNGSRVFAIVMFVLTPLLSISQYWISRYTLSGQLGRSIFVCLAVCGSIPYVVLLGLSGYRAAHPPNYSGDFGFPDLWWTLGLASLIILADLRDIYSVREGKTNLSGKERGEFEFVNIK